MIIIKINILILDISSFDFINVIDISYIFDDNYKNKYFDIIFRKRCNKLQVLNLSYIKISDIKVLEKVDFKELKELYLSGNKISDIKVFDFKELEKLDLSNNKISDIKILEKVDFKELKVLDLWQNNISDITVLKKANFKELEKLNLSGNNINKKGNYLILSKLKSKIPDFTYY